MSEAQIITNEKKIVVDGVEYRWKDLSDKAKQQITNIRVLDEEVTRLKNMLGICEMARSGYSKLLKDELPGDKPSAVQ
jgi:hypothetical protein